MIAAALTGAFPVAGAAGGSGEHLFDGSAPVEGKIEIGGVVVDFNAKTFACRNCHRRDAAGGVEGNAPPISWDLLSRPSATRPAYDDASFRTAIEKGIGPDGRRLDATMPRYDLADAVVGDLVAYLKALPALQRRGITTHSIRLGVVIAPDNRAPAELYYRYLDAALHGGDEKYFGRTIEIERLDGSRSDILARADEDVAAVVGLVPSQQLSVRDFEALGVPVLFPLTLLKGDEDATLVRALMPTLERQAEALVERAARDGRKRIGIARLGADIGPDDIDAGIAPTWLTPDIAPGDFDALVLLGNEVAEAERIVLAIPPGTPLYGIAGQLPELPEIARQHRSEITLVSGYAGLRESEATGEDLLSAHARAAAALTKAGILTMGRSGASRAALVAAFDGARFPALGLDFGRFPLTGSDEVSFLDFRVGP